VTKHAALRDGTLMTEGKISKLIFMFALPIIGAKLLQQMYHTVDTAVIGQFLGRDALAAVGSLSIVIQFSTGILFGISRGAGIVAAQYYGGRELALLKKTIHTSIFVSMLAGIVMALIGNLIAPSLLRFLNFPPEVAVLSLQYLRIFFIGVIPKLISLSCVGIAHAIGDSRRPMYYLLISGFINLLLNLLFIIVLGWGIASVAWATVISSTVAAILILYRITKLNDEYKFTFDRLKVDKAVLQQIIRIGLPIGLQTLTFAVPNLYVQFHINRFGEAAMAGVAAYLTIYFLLFAIVGGFSAAVSTFAGQNAGAGKVGRIRNGIRTSIIISFGISIVASVIMLSFAEPALSIFLYDSEAISYGLMMLRTLTPVFFIFGIAEVFLGAFRGLGKATQAMLISGISVGGVGVLWLFITTRIWDGISVVFLNFPVAWVALLIACIFYYRFGKWWSDIEVEKIQ